MFGYLYRCHRSSLRDILWYGPYNPARGKTIIKLLSQSAERNGYEWAGRLLAAVGNDSPEKLDNRNNLLADAGRVARGFTRYMESLRLDAREMYQHLPVSKSAEKMMGYEDPLRGPFENYLPLEALLHDATVRGIMERAKVAHANHEAPAGAGC